MSIVSDARNLIGKVDYVFGANDIPGGRGDCSAFTQYVYSLNGYSIGRDTTAQLQYARKNGEEVEYSSIQPGDLVFFEGTYRDGVSHVGIAVGGGKMVNLQGNGVMLEDIKADHWKDHYMAAYRIADPLTAGKADSVETVPVTNTSATNTMFSEWGLAWWGDIVVVIVIIACIGLGIFFMFKAFSAQLSGVIPSLDDIGNAVSKIKPSEGGAE